MLLYPEIAARGLVIVPGDPQQSLLLKRVLAKDMPPPRELIRAGVRPLESSDVFF